MNPAARLAGLCKQWQVPGGTSPWEVRGGNADDHGLTTWHTVSYGVDLIRQIERLLDGLEADGQRTANYRKYVVIWYRAVYSWGREWTTASSDQSVIPLNEPAMDALDFLADLLDRLRIENDISQSDREQLMYLFEEAIAVLNETSEVPETERIALVGLIQACRGTLGRLDVAGPTALRQQVAELALSLNQAAMLVHSPEKQSRFKSLASDMWWRAAAIVATSAIGTATTEVVQELMAPR
jgi:hypothetical protein